MSGHRFPKVQLLVLLLLVGMFGLSSPSNAQKGGPPVNPQAPVLNMPVPMGIQRGTSLELVLTGTNLADPVAFWTSIPGAKVTIPTDNNGKDAAKLRIQLEVPKEAPLGVHTVRLATVRGMSNFRTFCVDDLPQTLSAGTNRSRDKAQAVMIPSVVAGVMPAEASDYFKFTVQAGQRLSFEVLGRRLGSAFDPQIVLIDPRTQRELAYNLDSPGLQTDARLTHTFKDAGEYLVEIRDTQYKGGADYAYRLRIGDFPCATTPIPMGAKRGSKVTVTFAGTAVEGVAPVEVAVPADPTLDTVYVTPKGPNGLTGWPVALVVSDLDEVAEQEPNNEPAKASPVLVPGAVTGRFQNKGDTDYFKLPLKKGRWIIDAQTFELSSPTDVYMVLRDGSGKEVAKVDQTKAPRIDFTAGADGMYTLMAEHLNYWGGPAESYRISIAPYEAGFDLGLISDRYDIPQGQAAVITVATLNRRDYNGPIELTVIGPPGITGKSTIGAGPVPKAPAPAARIVVQSGPDVAMGAYPIKVMAKAKIGDKEVVEYASVRGAVSQNMAGLLYPPRHLLVDGIVAVTEKPPFTLTVKLETPEVVRGIPVNVTITADRTAGFTEEIGLAPIDLPPNVPAPPVKSIAKGQNEVKFQLNAPANVPPGDYAFSYIGTTKVQNKTYVVTALPVPLPLVPPFELKVEPEAIKVDAGGKMKFKVTAQRKGGYQGPIGLEVQNLPANVTAPKVNIDQGKNEIEIELSAAAAAAAGDKPDVRILGTATAAANQQNPSPNFTVSVLKK